jgi:hypothetical protein
MDALAVLAELDRLGVGVYAAGGHLHVRSRGAPLPDELRASIREHRDALVLHLSRTHFCTGCGDSRYKFHEPTVCNRCRRRAANRSRTDQEAA